MIDEEKQISLQFAQAVQQWHPMFFMGLALGGHVKISLTQFCLFLLTSRFSTSSFSFHLNSLFMSHEFGEYVIVLQDPRTHSEVLDAPFQNLKTLEKDKRKLMLYSL